MASGGPRPPRRLPLARRVGAWLTWWVLLMSFWVIEDDSISSDELLAGAAAAAIGAFVAELVTYQAATRLRMRIEWAAQALRLPGQVARDTGIVFAALGRRLAPRDTGIVFAALGRRLARGEEPPSGFRERPVRYGDDTAAGQTQRALLVGGSSFAPRSGSRTSPGTRPRCCSVRR
ncbi:MAG: hypothetical protein ACLPKI_26065 [Streptosporangiaceae bacterium]